MESKPTSCGSPWQAGSTMAIHAMKIFDFHSKPAKKNTRTAALVITAFLIIVTVACLLYLLLIHENTQSCVAEIYQNGQLIFSIPLDQVQEDYTLEIESMDGSLNRIEVRYGSIGVIWADCPDKLCVNQGFVDSPTIPVTCLPNNLVIRLRPARELSWEAAPDAVTY